MQILTGKLFKEMVLCGANTLHNNHPEIDALNVFPVPDGDTGTNMSMTFNAGAAEIKDMDSDNIYDIAKFDVKVNNKMYRFGNINKGAWFYEW